MSWLLPDSTTVPTVGIQLALSRSLARSNCVHVKLVIACVRIVVFWPISIWEILSKLKTGFIKQSTFPIRIPMPTATVSFPGLRLYGIWYFSTVWICQFRGTYVYEHDTATRLRRGLADTKNVDKNQTSSFPHLVSDWNSRLGKIHEFRLRIFYQLRHLTRPNRVRANSSKWQWLKYQFA